VIGHGTSTTTLVAAPLYQQAGLPMIAPTSTSTELATLPRSGPNLIFRVIASDQFTGTALARHLLSGKQQKPIVFYNAQSSYSKSLLEAFSTTIGLEGGQVVKTVDLSQGDPAGELQGAGADSLVLLPDSKSFEAAIAVAKANQGRLPILAGDAFYRIETLEQAGANLKGAVLAVPWHPRQSNPQFAQAAAQLWGGDINWRTALSYDALQVLKAAATGNLTPALAAPAARQALAEALGASGFSAPGATGVISFLPSGDRNSTVTLVRVQPGQRSGTGFDFVPLN
jgi:branched-chain amino acid transport system substrate-binding protein